MIRAAFSERRLSAAFHNGRALAVTAVLAVLAGCAVPPAAPVLPADTAATPQPIVPTAPATSEIPGGAAAPAQERPRRRAGSSTTPAPVPPAPKSQAEPEPDTTNAPPAEDGAGAASDGVLLGRGVASWYGPQFHGRRTASGERFDRNEYTAAHRTLPFGSRVCVRSAITGKAVVVRINDRGPFAPGRVIDLSQAAAEELGMLGLGLKPVELWQLGDDEDNGCGGRASPQPSARRTRASQAACQGPQQGATKQGAPPLSP
jgi:rare lipoprotein A